MINVDDKRVDEFVDHQRVEDSTVKTTQSSKKADFSYSEKDLLPEVNKGLQSLLRDFCLVQTDRETIHVTLVRAYGEAFESSAKAPKYNGEAHQKLAYSIRVEVSWAGRIFLGDSTLGSASGKVKIGEIDFENIFCSSEWQVQTKLDIECVPGMPSGAAGVPVPDASEVEDRLRSLVRCQGEAKLVDSIQVALKRMLVDKDFSFLKGPVKDVSSINGNNQYGDDSNNVILVGDIETSSFPTVHDDSFASCDDLRKQLLGKEFLRIIDTEDLESIREPGWKLRICTIHDRDIPALCEKLRLHSKLKSLDLYFNYISDAGMALLADALLQHNELERIDLRRNRIGDLGVQGILARLGSGQMKSLKEIDLRENEGISSLGHTMVNALGLMRPEIKIHL